MRNLIKIIALLGVILSLNVGTVYGSGYKAGAAGNEGMGFKPFQGDIWNEGGEFNADTGGRIEARVSCTDVRVDFDLNAHSDKITRILSAILQDSRTMVINATIYYMAQAWAIQQCGGSLEQILLQEYPEKMAEMGACFSEGLGESSTTSTGVAVGSANFVEIQYETNPGVGLKILSCLENVGAENYGDAYRSCLKKQTQSNVDGIRAMLNWAIQLDIHENLKVQQECILTEQAKQDDFVTANQEYGSIASPDGTVFSCEGGTCEYKKKTWAGFALTKEQDNQIKNRTIHSIEDAYKYSETPQDKKDEIYDFVINWYETIFLNGNYFSIHSECTEITTLDINTILFDKGKDRINNYSSEPGRLKTILVHDKVASEEITALLRQTCITYVTQAEQMMYIKNAEAPLPGFNSKAQQDVYKLGNMKLYNSMLLKNIGRAAKRTAIQARERKLAQEDQRFQEAVAAARKKIQGE